MRILHYSLGFPPYRRGGLTKYCLDLMAAQTMQKHVVGMCWPGEIGIIKKRRVSIIKDVDYNIGQSRVESYEIQGLLPVPLLEGVANPDLFMEARNAKIWEEFLKEWKPDVIHFHTLMGLPIEFVEKTGELGIKTVFTTHDYFGICPRTTLVCNNGIICDGNDPKYCAECCNNAPGYRELAILQSSIYRALKDLNVVKALRKKHWNESKNSSVENVPHTVVTEQSSRYCDLRDYYVRMLARFSVIHFNSSNTKDVYLSITKKSFNSKVISITHSMIQDNKKKKKRSDLIRFSYLGPDTYNKGYYLLKDSLKQLYEEGFKFQLNVYFEDTDEPFIVSHKPYHYDELGTVMGNADCVILPSLGNETFGFTVLEALSYGIPVIVSRKVGAKDLIEEDKSGFIVDEITNSLKEKLRNIIARPEVLTEMNNYIVVNTHIKTMSEHAQEIDMLYKNS